MEAGVRPQPKSPYVYMARPGQKFFLDEFIQPLSYPIYRIARQIRETDIRQVGQEIWNRVMSRIQYVLDRDQFGVDEWFQFPFEVLQTKKGDCEDTANLLTSLLVACGFTNAKTVYGTVKLNNRLYKHAWVEITIDGVPYLLESTMPEFRIIRRPDFYMPEFEIGWEYSARVGWGRVRAWAFGEVPIWWEPGLMEGLGQDMGYGEGFGADVGSWGYGEKANENKEGEELPEEEEGLEEEEEEEEAIEEVPPAMLPKLSPEQLKRLHKKLAKVGG